MKKFHLSNYLSQPVSPVQTQQRHTVANLHRAAQKGITAEEIQEIAKQQENEIAKFAERASPKEVESLRESLAKHLEEIRNVDKRLVAAKQAVDAIIPSYQIDPKLLYLCGAKQKPIVYLYSVYKWDEVTIKLSVQFIFEDADTPLVRIPAVREELYRLRSGYGVEHNDPKLSQKNPDPYRFDMIQLNYFVNDVDVDTLYGQLDEMAAAATRQYFMRKFESIYESLIKEDIVKTVSAKWQTLNRLSYFNLQSEHTPATKLIKEGLLYIHQRLASFTNQIVKDGYLYPVQVKDISIQCQEQDIEVSYHDPRLDKENEFTKIGPEPIPTRGGWVYQTDTGFTGTVTLFKNNKITIEEISIGIFSNESIQSYANPRDAAEHAYYMALGLISQDVIYTKLIEPQTDEKLPMDLLLC